MPQGCSNILREGPFGCHTQTVSCDCPEVKEGLDSYGTLIEDYPEVGVSEVS